MKRFAVICKMEFRMFARDFFGFFFALVFPVLMLLLFGGIYGNEPVSEGANVGMMDVCVPAYAVMVIGVTGLMSLPLTLANCKEKKIYKRFDATPVGKKSIILAQVLVNVSVAMMGILVLLVAGKILYHIQIRGTLISVGVAVVLSVTTMFSMGFLFTAIGQDLKSASFLCYLFYFVMLFLSGATIPDMLFPDTMKTIAKFLPMTHAVDFMQGVFAGDGLRGYGMQMLVLGGLTVIFVGVGAVLYRGKDWA